MNANEARGFLWNESCEKDGIVVMLRMGDDPGPDRMGKILLALRCVFEDLNGANAIDRLLAYALHCLANYSESQISSWMRQGRKWRDGLLEEELPNLLMAVESIFAGEWVG